MQKHDIDLEREAKDRFGHDGLRGGQRRVMEALLAGRSAAAIFPTGGGKSLCYQLTSQLLDGLTLVVSPLIALMKDQVDALAERGVAAHRLDSSLSAEEHRQVMSDVRSGRVRLLYVAPERFHNERFRADLERLPIALLAIDEAHCISEWGHNFRPDYLKLPKYARAFGAERVLALTATATTDVAEDIRRSFEIEAADVVRTRFQRDNLTLRLTPVRRDARDDALLAALRERPRGPTLVYVSLQKTAERVAERLRREGLDARPYHAGLADELRASTQEWFLSTPDGVAVATIAFGMGVDKPNIRYVYHYNLAKSLEGLAQETGRAGRDGEPAVCESFVCADDLVVLESFAYGDTPDRSSVAELVRVIGAEEEHELSLYTLSKELDVRALVLKTLLTYLELDGWIEAGTPVYGTYRFAPRMTGKELLARVDDDEERRFLGAVLKTVRKGRKWMTLDPDVAAKAAGAERARVVSALQRLHDDGLLELEASKVRQRYRRLRELEDPEAITDSLMERLHARERGELTRLRDVVALGTSGDCQANALAERFGDEPAPRCGRCSSCLRDGAAVELPPPAEVPIDEGVVRDAVRLLREGGGPDEVGARQVARVLCGLRTPATPRPIAGHRLFGALSNAPFDDVVTAARSALAG